MVSKLKGSHRLRDLALREAGELSEPFRRDLQRPFEVVEPRRSKIITVKSYLPEAVAFSARRKVYAYPLPLERQRKGRTIRTPLEFSPSVKFVPVKVRIRVPHRLPLVRSSYVSISDRRGKQVLNVHSRNQVASLSQRGELNRRRYSEFKGNRRFARYGQLNSAGANAFGSVAYAARRHRDIARIADAALVARAVLKGRYL